MSAGLSRSSILQWAIPGVYNNYIKGIYIGVLIKGPSFSQRAQYPLIKEYTLNR